MNKADLIAAVEKSTGEAVTPAVAAEAVDAVFSTIVRSVAKGESVTIIGFGVFEKRKRAARVARNPRTGEPVKVRATSVPAFRPSPGFKESLSSKVKLPKTGSVIRRAVKATAPVVAKKAAPVKVSLVKKAAAPVKKAAPVKVSLVKKAAPAKKVAAPVKAAAPVKVKASKKGSRKE